MKTYSMVQAEDKYTMFINKDYISWNEAESWCISREGHLASIHSQMDVNLILNMMQMVNLSHETPYIGLYRTQVR